MAKKLSGQTVYLAGGYGFDALGRAGIKEVISRLEKLGAKIINPFELNATLGQRMVELKQELQSGSKRSYQQIQAEMKAVALAIGKNNETAITNCTFVLAILDGAQVDDGTASEIGFAYAVGKQVMGLRTDFRQSGDYPGAMVNLQIEYFISASEGEIMTSLDELK